METWTVKRILDWIEGYLTEQGCNNPRLSAQWLVADTLGCSRLELYTDLSRPLSSEERSVLRDYTKRRAAGEPLQYITGTTDFRFLTLSVEPGVLIPRPETEVLVSEALAALDTGAEESVLAVDVCTGSGNIACSIAHELPQSNVIAIDISPDACALAQRNAEALGLQERIQVLEGDLGAPLAAEYYGMVDLVISNPPYIPTGELSQMDGEVTHFEPTLALDGGQDGLDIYRRILPFASAVLRQSGVLAVELHETCLDMAAALAEEGGFSDVRIVNDLAGKPRMLLARASKVNV